MRSFVKLITAIIPFLGAAACSSEAPEREASPESLAQNGQQLLSTRAVAPDPTETGPSAVTSAEYRFPATTDPDILGSAATELWARVYRPQNLENTPHPLIVVLHGNHATCGTGSNPRQDTNCQYTASGTCPSGYVVVPNHLGYAYVAEKLASHGYVVVSINANRGITCGGGVSGDSGLNLARGRLVLKHLQRLSEWNTKGGTPTSLGVDLKGKLDLGQLGLIGHSRGGEGMRAVYNLYRDSGSPWPARIGGVTFRGIFEIGPVDRQTSRTLDADGTVWSVLLPMCDGDVSSLVGIQPYDRMLQIPTESPVTPKSTFTVWGANHNFYNTEWQQSDSAGCTGHKALFPASIGSPEQRTTGLASMMGFIRANIGTAANASYNQMFNPMFDLPPVVTNVTRVDRGYTDSSSSTVTGAIEDFDKAVGTNTHGTPNDAQGITITHGTVPNHASVQKAGRISWQSASANTYFQTNWTAAGQGKDVSGYKTLDLRVSRQQSTLNPVDPTDFSIRLVAADGAFSEPVALRTYTDLRGPVGGRSAGGTANYHPILQTARIALADFRGIDLTQIRGVRFVFDATATGAIHLANVRLSKVQTLPASESLAGFSTAPAPQANATITASSGAGTMTTYTKGNAITGIRRVAASAQGADGATQGAGATEIEIELETADQFPVRNALPVLRVGPRTFSVSRHPNGDTRRIVFTLPEAEFAPLRSGDDVTVQYSEEADSRWIFGKLDKRALR
ncbi:hypothetical protein [Pendulispora albinea]|uniref:Uncharacterized protein n=1 Tax=Pendulispora albinea TaxID=2741071 RepID=A0ABZ2LSU9_9BACT